MHALVCRRYCSFLLAGILFFSAAALGAAPAAPDDNVIVEFDVFNDGDGLLVPVRINGKTYQFTVGTGDPYTSIDERLVADPIVWKKARPHDDPDYNPPLHECPAIEVGPLKFGPGQPCGLASFEQFQSVTGLPIQGILGTDFLQNYVLQIDSAAGKLRFLRTIGRDNSGKKILFSLDKGFSKIDVLLTGRPYVEMFTLNTFFIGSSVGLARDRFLEQHQAGFIDRLTRGVIIGRDVGDGATLNGYLKACQVGGLKIPSTTVTTSPKSTVGLGVLLNFNVILDFPAKRLVAIPRAGEPHRGYDKRSGLGVLLDENEVRVAYVVPKSPADEAEIEGGDVVLSVNDKPATEYRLHQIRRLLGGDAREARLKLRREEREFEVTLKLDSPEQRADD